MSGTDIPIVTVRSGEWPIELLDVEALRRTGWRPEPFSQFVLKIAARCNLSCDYCYVYEMADQSWRDRPVLMSPEVVVAAARRIGEHAATHGQDSVRVILHGGEPLLAGPERIARIATSVRAAAPALTDVQYALQTNGVALDATLLSVLRRHGVRVSISLDGPADAHDRHRGHANGNGSYRAAVKAVSLLRGEPELYGGLLCVVDLDNDPAVVFRELVSHAPPAVDFLLPHGTWSSPPAGRVSGSVRTPYADWLIAIFDQWYAMNRRETEIRLFSEIINLILGGSSGSEAVGLTPSTVVVIETDGAIEQVDALKSAYSGAAATGLSVLDHPLGDALRHPGIVARQIGEAALADACRRCDERRVCGGGYYPHRYRAGAGFRNPSVYCPDLLELIRHVRRRVVTDVKRFSGHGR